MAQVKLEEMQSLEVMEKWAAGALDSLQEFDGISQELNMSLTILDFILSGTCGRRFFLRDLWVFSFSFIKNLHCVKLNRNGVHAVN